MADANKVKKTNGPDEVQQRCFACLRNSAWSALQLVSAGSALLFTGLPWLSASISSQAPGGVRLSWIGLAAQAQEHMTGPSMGFFFSIYAD